MICPKCQHEKSRCIDSRLTEGTTRRRRKCLSCDARWTSYEMTLHEATGFYDHNPPFEQPLDLMRMLAELSNQRRQVAYEVIRGLLARDAMDKLSKKDAA